jgi:multidrug resistance efflux pump
MVSNLTTQELKRPSIPAARSVGFPRSTEKIDPAATTVPAPKNRTLQPPGHRPPTPKRPKGKFFIAFVLLSIMLATTSILWNEFFRYQAYGAIHGNVLRIASPMQGTVSQLLVDDGQHVEKGDLLAILNSIELDMKLSKLQSELEMARGTMATKIAEIDRQNREHSLELLRTQVAYFEILGQLQSETGKLRELDTSSEAMRPLNGRGVVSQVELDQLEAQHQGQQSKVDSLEKAVGELKLGINRLKQTDLCDPSLLESERARVNALQGELDEWNSFRRQKEVRAPASGRVIHRKRLPGEFVTVGTELLELLEDRSMEAHLFVTQDQAAQFPLGAQLHLDIPPHCVRLPFTIVRIEDETSSVPDHAIRYYQRNARLVALVVKPSNSDMLRTQGVDPVWLGAEVRLPRFQWGLGMTDKQKESGRMRSHNSISLADGLASPIQ